MRFWLFCLVSMGSTLSGQVDPCALSGTFIESGQALSSGNTQSVALGDLDDCRLLALRQPIRIAPDPLTGGLSAPDRDIRTGAVAS